MNLKLVLIVTSILVVVGHAQPSFPVAPLEDCYDGIQILDDYYNNSNITYMFNPEPSPGHVWLLVDDQAIDSFYGLVEGDYWHTGYKYNSFEELNKGIQKFYPVIKVL